MSKALLPEQLSATNQHHMQEVSTGEAAIAQLTRRISGLEDTIDGDKATAHELKAEHGTMQQRVTTAVINSLQLRDKQWHLFKNCSYS